MFLQNNHIQAFVYAKNWKSISNIMVEGGLYVISNFYTREALGTLRPTSSHYVINFSNSTTVQQLDQDDFMIPRHKFEFVDLSKLFNLTSTYENPDAPQLSTGNRILQILLLSAHLHVNLLNRNCMSSFVMNMNVLICRYNRCT